jgi:hypothetical protein
MAAMIDAWDRKHMSPQSGTIGAATQSQLILSLVQLRPSYNLRLAFKTYQSFPKMISI